MPSAGGALRRLVLGLVALLIAAGVAGPAVATAAPSIGGFSARALGPGGELTPQTYFQETLKPGDTFHGRLLVTNTNTSRNVLSVYSVDGLTGSTTGTVYANKSDPRKGAANWITPEKATLHMVGSTGKKPSTREVDFEVRVPADATPGDHVGAIALESAKKPKTNKGQFGVTEVIRVAVAVSIRVEGDASAAFKLAGMQLRALPGTQIPSLTIAMANTGQLLCRPALNVELSADGAALGSVQHQLDTVLPGASIQYPQQWAKPLKAGQYHAKATASGCGKPVTLESDLTLKGDLAGSKASPGVSTLPAAKNGLPTWALALIIILVAIIALYGGYLLAKRQIRKSIEQGTPPPAA